jgi:hypothetical protein
MSLLRRFAKLSSSASAVVEELPAQQVELTSYPDCPAMCLAYLRDAKCWLTEGVFRLSGNNTVMLALYRDFQRNKAPPALFRDVKGVDVHTIACLLKHWLRNLPEPLCTYALFDAFVATLDVVLSRRGEGNVCFDAVTTVIDALPRVNRAIFCDVFEMLHLVSAHADTNKMSAMNLSIVMSGNLLSQRDVDPITALMTMQPVVHVVELMTTNWAAIKEALAGDATSAAPAPTVTPSMRLPQAFLTEAELRRIHSESVRQTLPVAASANSVLELDDLPSSPLIAARAHAKEVEHGTAEKDLLHLNTCLRRASLTRQDSIMAKRRARADASAAPAVTPAKQSGVVVEATVELVQPRSATDADDLRRLCGTLAALSAPRLAQAMRHVACGRIVDAETDQAAFSAVRLLAAGSSRQALAQRVVEALPALRADAVEQQLCDLVELSALQLLQ